MRTNKAPLRLSTPPPLGLGVLLFGVAAVLAAAGALVRYYARQTPRPPANAPVEIPAPELEVEPAPTKP